MTRTAAGLVVLISLFVMACGGSSPASSSGSPAAPSSPAAISNISGNYFFNFDASNSCPNFGISGSRQRVYRAAVTQNGTSVAATLSATLPSDNMGSDGSAGNFAYQRMFGTVTSDGKVSWTFTIMEVRNGPIDLQTLDGVTNYLTIKSPRTGGSWQGTLGRSSVSCSAVDHWFDMTKR